MAQRGVWQGGTGAHPYRGLRSRVAFGLLGFLLLVVMAAIARTEEEETRKGNERISQKMGCDLVGG